ncbi:MAG TPA: DHA2 family efflux MFS transporter permease subunit [Polyangiaceae bacterium]|jgi:DHA2 family multidrug resistance protein|nr:DHA2 family efflux MFS transporter permease subunit [Polyangiaceae bacterium]
MASPATSIPLSSALGGVRPSRRPRPKVNKWLVTVSITFGTLMGAIDSSIVAVALPHMMGTLGATVQEITWISTGYIIANVVVMPLTAFLGRLFGQKRVYMLCLLLFLVGSILCGTARSLQGLLVYRAVQGLGAGALQPTEQAILRQTFPPKEQGMAMALFAMAVMLGPAIGPTLGGYIVDNYSWPWIFYINIPVGVIGLIMVATFVHEDEEIVAKNRELAEAQRKKVDWWGIGLMVIGLCTLQYVLEEGQQDDWFSSTLISVMCAVSAISIAAFVIRELTCEVPAVNIRLFKDAVFLSGTLIGALMFALLMATMFLLPLFMQTLLGFTATDAGLALMPRVLAMMIFVPIVGRIYNAVSPRIVIAVGVLFIAWAAYLMSHFTDQTSQSGIILALTTQGLGFSCLFVPLSTVALSAIPRHQMADATGLNSLFRQVGGSIGLAVAATLLSRYGVQARTALIAHVTMTDPAAMDRMRQTAGGFMARGFDAHTARELAMRAVDGAIAVQSQLLAFERVFLLAGVLFLLVLPLLIFLKTPDDETQAAAHDAAGPGKAEPIHIEM